jgi:hypothetical protein
MFTEKDIVVGTILRYRNHTDSYKYFRITKVFMKTIEIKSDRVIGSWEDSLFDGWFEGGMLLNGNPLRRMNINDLNDFITEFEMAKEIDGEWIKSDHTCAIKHWHEGCDIYFPIDIKVSRLAKVD